MAEEITIAELDDLVNNFMLLRDDYEAKDKIKKEAGKKLDEAEAFLMDRLKEANKTNYKVDGLGSVTKCFKLSFKTPKSPEDKLKFFGWLEEKYGREAMIGLQSVNSISLNSFLKEVSEVPPGLDAPTSIEYIQFRRA